MFDGELEHHLDEEKASAVFFLCYYSVVACLTPFNFGG